jgi:hypothetical protein
VHVNKYLEHQAEALLFADSGLEEPVPTNHMLPTGLSFVLADYVVGLCIKKMDA